MNRELQIKSLAGGLPRLPASSIFQPFGPGESDAARAWLTLHSVVLLRGWEGVIGRVERLALDEAVAMCEYSPEQVTQGSRFKRHIVLPHTSPNFPRHYRDVAAVGSAAGDGLSRLLGGPVQLQSSNVNQMGPGDIIRRHRDSAQQFVLVAQVGNTDVAGGDFFISHTPRSRFMLLQRQPNDLVLFCGATPHGVTRVRSGLRETCSFGYVLAP